MNTKVKYLNKVLSFNVLISVFLIFVFTLKVSGQQEKSNRKLLEGVILTADSLKPILNAHIISKINLWGTISDNEGKFNLLISYHDSILITSIGYRPIILFIEDTLSNDLKNFPVLMKQDTVLINEVIIRGFWDYRTFKQLIINMEPLDLGKFFEIADGIQKELKYNPAYSGIKGPVQALFDQFNKNARLERKLLKNRQDYNRLMIQMGRIQDTIPVKPEHMQE